MDEEVEVESEAEQSNWGTLRSSVVKTTEETVAGAGAVDGIGAGHVGGVGLEAGNLSHESLGIEGTVRVRSEVSGSESPSS